MNQLNQQDAEGILEVVNLLGPGLQQAISNAIVDAEIRLRLVHSHPDHAQHNLPPHPDHMPQLLWSCVYSAYIGSNTSSGELDYDPTMLHNNAAFHAEMALNAFKKRFQLSEEVAS